MTRRESSLMASTMVWPAVEASQKSDSESHSQGGSWATLLTSRKDDLVLGPYDDIGIMLRVSRASVLRGRRNRPV